MADPALQTNIPRRFLLAGADGGKRMQRVGVRGPINESACGSMGVADGRVGGAAVSSSSSSSSSNSGGVVEWWRNIR